MTKSKAFLEAIRIVNENFAKAKSYLNDKRLNSVEKKIIEAYIDFREGRFNLMIESLSKLKADDVFVESQRNMLLGLAYNGGDDIRLAGPYYIKAYELVKDLEFNRQKFFILYNLFVLNRNLKIKSEMAKYLEIMSGLDLADSKELKMMLTRCRFFFHSFSGEYEKAQTILSIIEKNKESLSENQIINHQIDKFDFRIKCDDLDGAYKVLNEMKSYRVYSTSSNFKFMKILLDHLSMKKAVYAYDKDFVDCPILFYQLSVIKALESSDKKSAAEWWAKLNQVSPDIYGENFQYKGDKCLFSVSFEKNYREESPVVVSSVEGLSKEQQLIYWLENSSGPIPKEKLYQELWGEELSDKNQLLKLSQLVTRVKKKFGVEVKSRKGCYFLEQQPEKKVS